MTYKEIVERLSDIRADLDKMHARQERDGMLDVDDEQRWNELTEEFEDLTLRKYKLEKQADMQRIAAADIVSKVNDRGDPVGDRRPVRYERGDDNYDADPMGEIDSISGVRGIRDPWDTTEIRLGMTPAAHATEFRARAMTAIEQMQGTTPSRREVMTRMLEQYETTDSRLSQQLLATSSPAYLRAFGKLARTQGKSEVLNERERAAVDRAMSLGDAAGGYLVPFQLDPTVILTSDGSLNEIRQLARQVIAIGDIWRGVSAGAVSWSFDPVAGVPDPPGTQEATAVSDDTPVFAQPTITIRTARGFVPISLEAYQDEANVTAEIGRLLAQGKDDLEANVFINGVAASNEPVGLITALVAAGGSVIVPSNTTDLFQIDEVYRVHDSLPARFRRSSSWLANALIYSLVRQMDTAGGGSFWANLNPAMPPALLGRPIYEAEAMDGVINTTVDNYVMAIGDFQHYVIADRIGMTVEFVPHLFQQVDAVSTKFARPTGQRGWFAYYRVGAGVTHAGAFRLLNIT